MTKAKFMAAGLKELRASGKVAAANKQAVTLPTVRAEFTRRLQTDLAARNAKVTAAWQQFQSATMRLAQSPAYAALNREATDLVARYNSASPADKIRLRQRAQQLHDQLLQMERAGALH